MIEGPFELARDAFGRLVFTGSDGVPHTGVTAACAFPVSAAGQGVAILDVDGHELAWIEHLNTLAPEQAQLLAEALTQREFMPEIRRVKSVSGFVTPCIWNIETDRGDTAFVLKGEEDIRRLAAGVLLVADNHGVQFLIRNLNAMDRHSRKLLDRFL